MIEWTNITDMKCCKRQHRCCGEYRGGRGEGTEGSEGKGGEGREER